MSINICPMVALAAELTNVPLWLCIPFACLLLCIAIIPLVKENGGKSTDHLL